MHQILKDTPLPKTTADEYGTSIENMAVDSDSILIPDDARGRVLAYVKRKYGENRTYVTRTVESQIRLYRTK